MSHHGALISELMQHLADESFGVYRESAVYAANERGIVTSVFPSTPAEVISVTLYDVEYTRMSATAERKISTASVQIKYRLTSRDPLAGVAFFDQLGGALAGKRIALESMTIVIGDDPNFANLGQQNGGGWVFSTNWQIHSLQAIQAPGPRETAATRGTIEPPTTGQTVQEGQTP